MRVREDRQSGGRVAYRQKNILLIQRVLHLVTQLRSNVGMLRQKPMNSVQLPMEDSVQMLSTQLRKYRWLMVSCAPTNPRHDIQSISAGKSRNDRSSALCRVNRNRPDNDFRISPPTGVCRKFV